MPTPTFEKITPHIYKLDLPVAGRLMVGVWLVQEADGWDTGLGRLYELIAGDFVYPDPMNLMTCDEDQLTFVGRRRAIPKARRLAEMVLQARP